MTTILVVDDEPDILDSTAQVLQMAGFTVATEGDAGAILRALRRAPPDLLLQDINMPGLDLRRLIEAIRADPKLRGVRILIFTAADDIKDVSDRVGADGYIQKPFDSYRIKRMLEKFLAKPVGA